MDATNNGAKFVKLEDGIILNPSTITEMYSDEQALEFNPILGDPDWQRYLSGNGEAAARLDRKYPLSKFAKEWDEANDSRNSLVVK